MRAHGVLALGRLFDQVEFLMDFSSPLTDEAMEGGGRGVGVGVGGGALLPWSAALGCRRAGGGHLSLVVGEQSAETQRANAALTSVGQRESQEVWRL